MTVSANTPRKKVVPKAGDLYVLALDEPELAKHVKPHSEEHEVLRPFRIPAEQVCTHRDAGSDIGEVEQVEDVSRSLPQRNGQGLES